VRERREVRTIDYHTAGEPFRIVVGGAPEIRGDSVRARRATAARTEEIDHIRRLLCHEPRGHADMYGCFLVPPDDAGAHLGALFWHKDGFSTACGHGTIALGTWAVESGLVAAAADGDSDVIIDVPSGRVTARVRRGGGRVESVTFRNVPAYVLARGISVATSFGSVPVDVAYGGAIYGSAPAPALGLRVTPEALPDLIRAGREIKREIERTIAGPGRGAGVAAGAPHESPHEDTHGGTKQGHEVYGTILYEELPDTAEGPHQRNVTVFADGQVDRSPCGSGTSARLALIDLAPGRVLTHDSVVDTRFRARIVAATAAEQRRPVTAGGTGPTRGVITEIEGGAFRTGEHVFTLDPRDPLGTGFVLR
jgi:proline racemase